MNCRRIPQRKATLLNEVSKDVPTRYACRMGKWQTVKEVSDPLVKRRVVFESREDRGFFRFAVMDWIAASDEDEGALGDGFWLCQQTSGLHGSLEDCESEAFNTVAWLRDNIWDEKQL